MSKFLITGGAGFIGLNYLMIMTEKYPDDYFICLDCLTYAANYDELKELKKKKNFCFYKADICNKDTLDSLFQKEKIDYVINFAAESDVDKSIIDSDVFIRTNIYGTKVLLDVCRKYGIRRFHQVSTDEVYGPALLNEPSFTEKDKLNPTNPYSASKAGAEMLVFGYHQTYGLPITISRSSNNYGPYQNLEKLIPLWISKALNNSSLPVYGNGLNIRDWLYVKDNCQAIDLIVRNGRNGEVYNIGGGNEKTNLEIADLILKELKLPSDFYHFVQDRKGHDFRYSLNTDKITNELGWKPSKEFKQGLRETILYFRNKSCF
ncbi:MAG: dTDP-glucose 4,6-dehydratase [Bacilli bacterium]